MCGAKDYGRVAERLKALVSNTNIVAILSRVRISPLPLSPRRSFSEGGQLFLRQCSSLILSTVKARFQRDAVRRD